MFAATAYIEKNQMERNLGICGIREKQKEGSGGSSSYTLDDPCSVLDNIKNTPRYWKKAKSELIRSSYDLLAAIGELHTESLGLSPTAPQYKTIEIIAYIPINP